MRRILAGTVLIALSAGCAWISSGPDWERLLRQTSLPASIDSAGRLGGEGARFLADRIAESQYFLVGEEHGVHEIATVSKGLLEMALEGSYRTLVIETGPHTAKKLEQLLHSDDGLGGLRRFLDRYPFSIPFYALQEEAEFLEAMVRGGGSLAGIDQEFILAPQFLLPEILAQKSDSAGREVLAKLAAAEHTAVRALLEKRDPSQLAMLSGSFGPELLARLEPDRSDPAGILADLTESQIIYRLNLEGKGRESNQRRAELNRNQLQVILKSLPDKGGKLFLKLGALHVARGTSLLGVDDLGGALAEQARAVHQLSFHLIIVAATGTQNIYLPFRSLESKASPIPTLGTLKEGLQPWLSSHGGEVRLFDLRRARESPEILLGLPSEARRIAELYDAVLVLPEGTASKLLVDTESRQVGGN